MSSRNDNNSSSLPKILRSYRETLVEGGRDGQSEFEVRFGTVGPKTSRAQYQSVIKRILDYGFINTEETYSLNCIPDREKLRVEIKGLQAIQIYCDQDSFQKVMKSVFVTKKEPMEYNGKIVQREDFPEFGFRASLSLETDMTQSPESRELLSRWNNVQKSFRLIHRFTFKHPELGFNLDLSIVKQATSTARSFADSNIANKGERYEIEIEADNSKVHAYKSDGDMLKDLKNMIKLVLSGLQSSNYPISYVKGKEVLDSYIKLLWGEGFDQPIGPRNFVGPSSVSLQRSNLAPKDPALTVPSIQSDYTLTEKADGMRKLLYVDTDLKVYLITTNMDVQFTGAVSNNPESAGTLIDGEHILNAKDGTFINLYAAFDIYYVNKVDVRSVVFISSDTKAPSRLTYLEKSIAALGLRGVVGPLAPIRVESKKFYQISGDQTVFDVSRFLLSRLDTFEYETDGIIFTPSNTGVGVEVGKQRRPLKFTWEQSLKWKPPQYNTIDFLVTFQKRPDGLPTIKTLFQQGLNGAKANEITEYQPVVLRVGFDENKHGYINPCKDVLDQKWRNESSQGKTVYQPVQFFPSNPPDNSAGLGNFVLVPNSSGGKDIVSEEGEVVEDNTIVECRYDQSKKEGWRWIPLRVRYDKTAELRSGKRNFGNAYHVADSNWHSIHHPVTKEMLESGKDLPDQLVGEDVYYSSVKGKSNTVGLRNFHNLYVKKKLITSVARPGQTLIDLAVGQGGDIPKWIAAELAFVLGIDISVDNIENRLNGVCARYLNYAKKTKKIPSAVFVVGSSSGNIRSGEGISTDKGKMIVQSLFGNKQGNGLGRVVEDNIGIGQKGFDICSVQFALHYMFEGQGVLNNFLRNVSETTKVGGYFICTSYDGDRVFQMLQNTAVNDSISLDNNGKKMWEVTKRYSKSSFPDNGSCVGYAIDVYQESIGKTFREYLVKFSYLTRLLEEYGFKLLSVEDAKSLGLPSGTGGFKLLYDAMLRSLGTTSRRSNNYGQADSMSASEQKVSFLNQFAVFKKVSMVDARRVAYTKTNTEVRSQEAEAETEKGVEEGEEMTRALLKPRKVNRKLVLRQKKMD